MADLEEVRKHLEESGNVEYAQLVEGFQNNFNENVERVGKLELDVKTSAEKRDALKTLIRNVTGLEQITEEGLKGILENGGGEADEILRKENESLRTQLAEGANAVDTVTEHYEGQLNGMRLERAASMLGIEDETNGSHAFQTVLKELNKNAKFDEAEITYKNPDGTTIFNKEGSPAGIKDQYELLKTQPEFEYLFKDQFKKGGGKNPQGPTTNDKGVSLRRSTMSAEDKVAYIAKNSLAAYSQLPY
jgi:flagellar biosynthesis/type III secretory pathway protein FliH